MSTPPPSETPAANGVPSRRGKFYHDTVILEVEGVLHCVYRYGFEKWSHSVFRDMFALPQGEGHCGEGKKDENPIRLVGCTNSEFESLLEVMYPPGGLMQPGELSKEEWIGVLKLSRLWDMPEIASSAIKKLSTTSFKLTPIEKITLGKAYGVSIWLKEGFTSLVSDIGAVSLKDLSKLGWETACRILWVREEMAQSSNPDFVVAKGSQVFCSYCSDGGYNCKGGEKNLLTSLRSSCTRCGRLPVLIEDNNGNAPTSQKATIPDRKIGEMIKQMFEEDLKNAEEYNPIMVSKVHLTRGFKARRGMDLTLELGV